MLHNTKIERRMNMKVEQILYANGKYNKKPELNDKCNWVLVLGNKYLIKDNNVFNILL